jgi:hypothetical protein
VLANSPVNSPTAGKLRVGDEHTPADQPIEADTRSTRRAHCSPADRADLVAADQGEIPEKQRRHATIVVARPAAARVQNATRTA